MPFVAQVGEREHDNRGQDVWRRDKALRGRNAESHTDVEDDG